MCLRQRRCSKLSLALFDFERPSPNSLTLGRTLSPAALPFPLDCACRYAWVSPPRGHLKTGDMVCLSLPCSRSCSSSASDSLSLLTRTDLPEHQHGGLHVLPERRQPNGRCWTAPGPALGPGLAALCQQTLVRHGHSGGRFWRLYLARQGLPKPTQETHFARV